MILTHKVDASPEKYNAGITNYNLFIGTGKTLRKMRVSAGCFCCSI